MITLTFNTTEVTFLIAHGNGVEAPPSVDWGRTRSGGIKHFQTQDWLYTLTYNVELCPMADYETYLSLYRQYPENTILVDRHWEYTGAVITPVMSLTHGRCNDVDFILRFRGTREATS